MKKYVESGLFDMWERFAAILKFRWTFIKTNDTNEYVNVISLDAKFVAIISTFSAAYACHLCDIMC